MLIRRPRIQLERGDTIGGTAPLILMDRVSFSDRRSRFLRRDDRKKTSKTVWALVWVAAIVATGVFAAWRVGLPLGGVVERVAGLF